MADLPTRAEIWQLIAPEMHRSESLMHQEMTAEVPFAESVMHYAIGNRGKRFRPLLTLLSAGLCGYRDEHCATAAAFIEFIHNATLLHDDVIDESEMRRGKPSANVAFSNAASVLVGDFLYTRAFQLMVRTGNPEVLETMAEATNLISTGEIMQLDNMYDPEVDEARYYRVIELKTAVLFSAACKVAAQLAGVARSRIDALAEYGKKLGLAFQILDDMLDYTGDVTQTGKATGNDLSEGKPTMPLIRAQTQLDEKDRTRLRSIIEQGEREAIDEVITLLGKTDALQYSYDCALKMVREAVDALRDFEDSSYKNALISLAYQAVNRDA